MKGDSMKDGSMKDGNFNLPAYRTRIFNKSMPRKASFTKEMIIEGKKHKIL